MTAPKPDSAAKEKEGLHPRNLHRFGYDFEALVKTSPELVPFVFTNKFQTVTIDFAIPEAVKALNGALLKHFYDLQYWDIPQDYLVPPVPGRADYIHHAADLLASNNKGVIPVGDSMNVLDIGVGASCVYPIIGHKSYQWSFVGADSDSKALKSAQKIIDKNVALQGSVVLRVQKTASNILAGMIKPDDEFDLVICNPPFHSSLEKVHQAAERKWSNLKVKSGTEPTLNFAGQQGEIIFPGGEDAFVKKMIVQSAQLPNRCYWYTSLISKETTLSPVYKTLKKVKALDVRTISMAQGQKQSRLVAWTFLSETEQRNWRERHWWNS